MEDRCGCFFSCMHLLISYSLNTLGTEENRPNAAGSWVWVGFFPPSSSPKIKGTRVLRRPYLKWGAEVRHTDEYAMSCSEAQSPSLIRIHEPVFENRHLHLPCSHSTWTILIQKFIFLLFLRPGNIPCPHSPPTHASFVLCSL